MLFFLNGIWLSTRLFKQSQNSRSPSQIAFQKALSFVDCHCLLITILKSLFISWIWCRTGRCVIIKMLRTRLMSCFFISVLSIFGVCCFPKIGSRGTKTMRHLPTLCSSMRREGGSVRDFSGLPCLTWKPCVLKAAVASHLLSIREVKSFALMSHGWEVAMVEFETWGPLWLTLICKVWTKPVNRTQSASVAKRAGMV